MIAAAWDRLRLFNIGDLFVHRGRTLMSLTVMAVSGSLLVAVLAIAGSVTGSVDKLVDGLGGRAVLEVSGITDAGFGAELLEPIERTPGVATAVPMLRVQVGAGDERALVIGADSRITALEGDLTGSLTGDPMRKLATVPNGVLVGPAFDYREGDTFPLGSGTATVAGFLEGAAAELNGGHIIAGPLPLVQHLTGREGRLDSVQIIPGLRADVEELRAALTDAVDGRAVVADPAGRTARAAGAVMIVRYSSLMAAAAALIVSAFLIYNAMAMAIAQRRPTLSMLRAIGGERGPMVRDLLVEAALLGLLGGGLGALIGIAMGRIAIERLPAAIMQSVEARIEYLVPWYAVPAAIVACVMATVTAAALAARAVYRVEPVEALAPVGTADTDTASTALWWASLIGGGALAVFSVFVARTDLGPWSLISISTSFAAAIVLCFAATGPIVRVTGAIARLFGAPGALGATTLERAPRRVWATVMTVLIGVAAVVAVGNASRNMVDSTTAGFRNLGNTAFWVTPGSMAQFPTGPLLPADLRQKVAAVPGVAAAHPAQMAFATLGAGRVMLQGYPIGSDSRRLGTDIDDEVIPRMVAGEGVVISRDIARALRVEAGADLTLPTPTGEHIVRVLQVIPYFTVVAGVVMMGLDQLREWYGRPGETVLAVDLEPGADPETVRAAIRQVVPPEFHIDSGAEAVAAVSGSVRQGAELSTSILWIVVVVSTVALLNTLMLSVLERRREIGVLRAMGTGRGFLLRSVSAEAAGIGLVGAVMGIALGAGVHYLSTVAIGHATSIDIGYEPSALVLGYGMIAMVLALIGSVPPAVRAARLPIVRALAVD